MKFIELKLLHLCSILEFFYQVPDIFAEKTPLVTDSLNTTASPVENGAPLLSSKNASGSRLDRSSRKYYLGCVFSVISAIGNALGYTTLQVCILIVVSKHINFHIFRRKVLSF